MDHSDASQRKLIEKELELFGVKAELNVAEEEIKLLKKELKEQISGFMQAKRESAKKDKDLNDAIQNVAKETEKNEKLQRSVNELDRQRHYLYDQTMFLKIKMNNREKELTDKLKNLQINYNVANDRLGKEMEKNKQFQMNQSVDQQIDKLEKEASDKMNEMLRKKEINKEEVGDAWEVVCDFITAVVEKAKSGEQTYPPFSIPSKKTSSEEILKKSEESLKKQLKAANAKLEKEMEKNTILKQKIKTLEEEDTEEFESLLERVDDLEDKLADKKRKELIEIENLKHELKVAKEKNLQLSKEVQILCSWESEEVLKVARQNRQLEEQLKTERIEFEQFKKQLQNFYANAKNEEKKKTERVNPHEITFKNFVERMNKDKEDKIMEKAREFNLSTQPKKPMTSQIHLVDKRSHEQCLKTAESDLFVSHFCRVFGDRCQVRKESVPVREDETERCSESNMKDDEEEKLLKGFRNSRQELQEELQLLQQQKQLFETLRKPEVGEDEQSKNNKFKLFSATIQQLNQSKRAEEDATKKSDNNDKSRCLEANMKNDEKAKELLKGFLNPQQQELLLQHHYQQQHQNQQEQQHQQHISCPALERNRHIILSTTLGHMNDTFNHQLLANENETKETEKSDNIDESSCSKYNVSVDNAEAVIDKNEERLQMLVDHVLDSQHGHSLEEQFTRLQLLMEHIFEMRHHEMSRPGQEAVPGKEEEKKEETEESDDGWSCPEDEETGTTA